MRPGKFSFIGDEFENIFHSAELFLPGIEKLAGVYYSADQKDIRIISRERGQEADTNYGHITGDVKYQVMIQRYRKDNKPWTWIMKEELPFDFSTRTVPAQNIFTELERVILVMRYKNQADQLYDLLFIYFNHHLGNFGLNRTDKILTTDHKTIIGHLLHYQFKSIMQLNRHDKALLQSLNRNVQALIREKVLLKQQLEQVRAGYGESMVNLAMQHLQDLANDRGKVYIFSDDAVNKIREYKGNLRHLPAILANAVNFTENLMMAVEESALTIEDYCLDFDSYQLPEDAAQNVKKIDSRQSRAMQLLDRLEKAAISLKSRNVPLTSANVGQALDAPVTAPAITDALGKSRDV
ncbi:MAG: hypothetical protein R6W71_04590, partial [Bacteroidales bacterium]